MVLNACLPDAMHGKRLALPGLHGKKGFSPVAELMKSLVEDFDCKFYICASCVKPYGLEGAEWIKNAEVKPGSFLGVLLMKRQNVTF